MINYNATITLTTTLAEDAIMDAIAPYHGVLTTNPTGHTITITYPADSATQATATGIAIAERLGTITAIDVLPTTEYDRRNGLIPIPDLISVEEAARELGISRQAVVKRIRTGSLQALRVGRAWIIPSATLTDTSHE